MIRELLRKLFFGPRWETLMVTQNTDDFFKVYNNL